LVSRTNVQVSQDQPEHRQVPLPSSHTQVHHHAQGFSLLHSADSTHTDEIQSVQLPASLHTQEAQFLPLVHAQELDDGVQSVQLPASLHTQETQSLLLVQEQEFEVEVAQLVHTLSLHTPPDHQH